MIVIVISLVAAAAQMGLLLLTARVLGAGSYSTFSLIITVAIFVAACCSEWLRMILARQGGSPRRRMRGALLGGLRAWALKTALTLQVLMFLSALAVDMAFGRSIAITIIATSVVAAGTMLSDMAGTFLRFTATQQAYNRFALIRVAVTGGASFVAALFGADGAEAAMAFGTAALICGGGFVIFLWPTSVIRKGLVFRLSPVGWSLASGSLGTNISMMIARLALGLNLPAAVSGAALLAIDLATRGANVMGVAINTWGNRLLINAAHYGGPAAATREFRRVSAVFLSLWFSATIFGMFACLGMPLVTLTVSAPQLYLIATVPTLLAIFFLFLRNFLFDAFLSAIERHREVAAAGAITVTLVGLGALFFGLLGTPGAGLAAFPTAVAASLVAYVARNKKVLWEGVDRRAAAFGMKITLLVFVTVGLAAASASRLAVCGAVLTMALLAAMRLWQLYGELRVHARRQMGASDLAEDTVC